MTDYVGYILRIASKRWVEQVFELAIYYTGLNRRWKPGQTILFMHKTDVGDAVVGYGVIQEVCERGALSKEEMEGCSQRGWKRAIIFEYVKRLENPVPAERIFPTYAKYRGRYFHGLPVSKKQIDAAKGLHQTNLT